MCYLAGHVKWLKTVENPLGNLIWLMCDETKVKWKFGFDWLGTKTVMKLGNKDKIQTPKLEPHLQIRFNTQDTE